LFLLFPDNLAVDLDLLVLQDKHIVNKYIFNSQSLRNRPKQLAKGSPFLPVSKARANKCYICIGPSSCCYHEIVWIYGHEHDKKKEKQRCNNNEFFIKIKSFKRGGLVIPCSKRL
jgi:hypothetical protein